MKYQDYLSEEASLPIPTINVVVPVCKYDEYGYFENNGNIFIYGTVKEGFEEKESFIFADVQVNRFFWDLMIFYRDLPNEILSLDVEFIRKAKISTDIIKSICRLCKTHGLPFWCYDIHHNPFCNQGISDDKALEENNIIYPIIPFKKIECFPLCTFLKGIEQLRFDFRRTVAFYEWDNLPNVASLIRDSEKQIINSLKIQFKKRHFLSLIVAEANPFTIRWDYKTFSLYTHCNNLMHLAAYQLCTMSQTGFLGSGRINICETCHEPFIARRKDQKYCHNPCTPQAAHMRKIRSKNSLKTS